MLLKKIVAMVLGSKVTPISSRSNCYGTPVIYKREVKSEQARKEARAGKS
jgi:hypothetical protein